MSFLSRKTPLWTAAAGLALLLGAAPRLEAAGLAVTDLSSITAATVAGVLAGAGVTISNVTYVGSNFACGTFTGGTGIIGFNDGIVMSSGNVTDVPGTPLTGVSTSFGTGSDPDLDSLAAPQTSNDKAILEFDVIPQGPVLTFQFVFASDEYNTYANSPYNDVFGFWINGVNVALVPGTGQPISINTVNGGNPLGSNAKNPQYYINNEMGSLQTSLNGLTVMLTATANVTAGVINHIKLGIADGSDMSLDSAVFIKAGSFMAPTPSPTRSPSYTISPTFSVSPTPSYSPTRTPSFTLSPTWTVSPTFSVTSTKTPSASVTSTCTQTPTATATPSKTPSATLTATCTQTPSSTVSPSSTQTQSFTVSPTVSQTFTVSQTPTVTLTLTPTPPPLILKLLPPNPNPAKEETVWMPYYLGVEADVHIQVWTVAGEMVRSMHPGWKPRGYNEDPWDQKNEAGQKVGSGIFVYRVRAESAHDEVKEDFSKCAIAR